MFEFLKRSSKPVIQAKVSPEELNKLFKEFECFHPDSSGELLFDLGDAWLNPEVTCTDIGEQLNRIENDTKHLKKIRDEVVG